MCEFPVNPPTKCEDFGRYQDYLDCNRYYKCNQIGAAPIHMNCLAGKYYDASSSSCKNGKCC